MYDNDIHSPHPGVQWELTQFMAASVVWNELTKVYVLATHVLLDEVSCYHGDDLKN